LSERIEGKSRPPQSGWKVIPQSRAQELQNTSMEWMSS